MLSKHCLQDFKPDCHLIFHYLMMGYITALIQPVAGGEASNPRITWGKAQKGYSGRDQMPVTVLVHHGLADGIHMHSSTRI